MQNFTCDRKKELEMTRSEITIKYGNVSRELARIQDLYESGHFEYLEQKDALSREYWSLRESLSEIDEEIGALCGPQISIAKQVEDLNKGLADVASIHQVEYYNRQYEDSLVTDEVIRLQRTLDQETEDAKGDSDWLDGVMGRLLKYAELRRSRGLLDAEPVHADIMKKLVDDLSLERLTKDSECVLVLGKLFSKHLYDINIMVSRLKGLSGNSLYQFIRTYITASPIDRDTPACLGTIIDYVIDDTPSKGRTNKIETIVNLFRDNPIIGENYNLYRNNIGYARIAAESLIDKLYITQDLSKVYYGYYYEEETRLWRRVSGDVIRSILRETIVAYVDKCKSVNKDNTYMSHNLYKIFGLITGENGVLDVRTVAEQIAAINQERDSEIALMKTVIDSERMDVTKEIVDRIRDLMISAEIDAKRVSSGESKQNVRLDMIKRIMDKKFDRLCGIIQKIEKNTNKTADEIFKESVHLLSPAGDLGNKFDCCPNTIAIADGMLYNFATKELRKRVSSDHCTFERPLTICADYDAAFVNKFFLDIANEDEEIAEYIKSLMGYFMTGEIGDRSFYLFTGTGRNGKSTLVDVMKEIMGPYRAELAKSIFIQRKEQSVGAATPEYMVLRSARMGTVSEAKSHERINSAMVKQITGGDEISGRGLHEQTCNFKSQCKLIMITNHLPRCDIDDEALYDRVKIVEFNKRFDVNPKFAELVMSKVNDFFNVLVGYSYKYYMGGISVPGSLKALIGKYKNNNDTFQSFLDEFVEYDPDTKEKTPTKSTRDGYSIGRLDMYKKYEEHCDQSLRGRITKQEFYAKIQQLCDSGTKKISMSKDKVYGIKLLDSFLSLRAQTYADVVPESSGSTCI